MLFVQDLGEVGSRLQQLDKAYAAARNKLTEGRGNLISRSEQLSSCSVPAPARACRRTGWTGRWWRPWKRPERSEIGSIPCPGFEKTEAFREGIKKGVRKDALKMIME